MTKEELITRITTVSGDINKKRGRAFLDAFVKVVQEGLKEDGVVRISGLGTFKVVTTKPRKGKNPQTGETIEIPARRVVKFKPAKELKECVA